ncbi:carbohydrate binding domain-containing protein [Natroniella sp. ANB-PHB2]|uniref:carbohydrate binding domain-containing protein n=1 Tax=Natroniella sp. ANB-PHB2 TaxID=3384444 RepID=UPI0038D4E9DC
MTRALELKPKNIISPNPDNWVASGSTDIERLGLTKAKVSNFNRGTSSDWSRGMSEYFEVKEGEVVRISANYFDHEGRIRVQIRNEDDNNTIGDRIEFSEDVSYEKGKYSVSFESPVTASCRVWITVYNRDYNYDYEQYIILSGLWVSKESEEQKDLFLDGELSEFRTDKVFQISEGVINTYQDTDPLFRNGVGIWEGRYSGDSVIHSNGKSKAGRYSLKVNAGNHDWGGASSPTQENTLTPNEDNTISLWVYLPSEYGYGDSMRLNTYTYPSNERRIFDRYDIPEDQWTRITATFNPGDDTDLELEFYKGDTSTTGHYFIDCVQVEAKSHPTPFVEGTREGYGITVNEFSEVPDALEFDGEGSFIEVDHKGLLDFGTGDFTVLYIGEGFEDHRHVAFCTKRSFNNSAGLFFSRASNPPEMYFGIGDGNDSSWSNIDNLKGNFDLSSFAFVRDNGVLKYYIDNELKGSSTMDYNIQNSSNLLIGIDQNNTANFSGMKLLLAFFNRKLSQEEIKYYHNNYLTGNEEGLVGLWRMNEGAGDKVFDYSGNGNHGEVNGADWVYSYDGDFTIKNGMLYVKGELSEGLGL